MKTQTHIRGAALPALLLSTFLSAQDPQRSVVPSTESGKGHATAPRAKDPKLRPAALAQTVTHSTWIEPSGDAPDFAPSRTEYDAKGNARLIATGNPYTLSFANGEYVPPAGLEHELVQRITAEGRAFGFIMIRGRMSRGKLETLRKTGVKLLGRHTWQSVKAEIPATALTKIAEMPFVHWVGTARPDQKLDGPLAEAMAASPAHEKLEIVISLFDSDRGPRSQLVVDAAPESTDPMVEFGKLSRTIPNGPVHQALEALGFEFKFYNDRIFTFHGHATKAQILAIRDLNPVVFIELEQKHTTFHDQTMAMVSQDRVRQAYPGTRVPVGIIDTGVNNNPWHNDLKNKAYIAWDTTGLGALADLRGHGTHVAGTVFGRGAADARFTGAAPGVGAGLDGDRIFIGRYLDNNGDAVGDVTTLYDRFARDYTSTGNKVNPRPRIINCSWGSRRSSGYIGTESGSRNVDDIVSRHGQSYVFAAGNKGTTANYWAGSPAVAKNVLTVGSLKDTHTSSQRPGEPSSFTRYGTLDGRRKPDVSAPGEILTSCDIGTSNGYTNKQGTSMAAPTVAGCLASYLDRSPGATAAALKAITVAAAKAGSSIDPNTVEGHGLINSHKMNYASSRSSWSMYKGNLTYPNTNASEFFVTVPSNAVDVKVVVAWIEPAASSGASKARVNNMRLFMDTPPYTSGASGEMSFVHSSDTVFSSANFSTSLRGERTRFTLHADSLAAGHTVNWAVCVFWYLKNPRFSRPTVTASLDKTLVTPGESVIMTATIHAGATDDEFSSAQLYVENLFGGINSRLERVTDDFLVQIYDSGFHTSYPFPRLGAGNTNGMVVGQGERRTAKFTLRTPTTSGTYDYAASARHHGSFSAVSSAPVQVCVDGLPPTRIANLRASKQPNRWYNDDAVEFRWDKPQDNGCAGLKDARYELSNTGLKHPDASSTSLTALRLTTNFMGSGDDHYFSIRPFDRLDNFANPTSIGPFKIDLSKPKITTLAARDQQVTTPVAEVQIDATDTHSGIAGVQYSMDGSSWSPVRAIPSGYWSIDLTRFGGNASPGPKRISFRVRDRAGNEEVSSIIVTLLPPPTISTATISSLEAVNEAYFELQGTGFDRAIAVDFHGTTITAQHTTANHDWWVKGCFRIMSATVLRVHPPQGLPTGSYGLRVSHGSFSNRVGVTITANTSAVLLTNRVVTTNQDQAFLITKAGLAPTVTAQVLLASLSDVSSVIPNVFDFDLGNNFAELVLFPQFGFDSDGISRLVAPTTPVVTGLSVFYQAAYLDFTPSAAWPMPASNVRKTIYR